MNAAVSVRAGHRLPEAQCQHCRHHQLRAALLADHGVPRQTLRAAPVHVQQRRRCGELLVRSDVHLPQHATGCASAAGDAHSVGGGGDVVTPVCLLRGRAQSEERGRGGGGPFLRPRPQRVCWTRAHAKVGASDRSDCPACSRNDEALKQGKPGSVRRRVDTGRRERSRRPALGVLLPPETELVLDQPPSRLQNGTCMKRKRAGAFGPRGLLTGPFVDVFSAKILWRPRRTRSD